MPNILRFFLALAVTLPAMSQSYVWRPIGPGGAEAPRALVAHPTSSGIVFAPAAFGVLQSVDSGASWRYLLYSRTSRMQHLAIDPVRPEVIVAGGMNGVVRSVDGGASWTNVSSEAADAIAFAADGTLLVAWSERGLMKSADDGATWSAVSGVSRSHPVTAFARNGNAIFAAIGSALYVSTDHGAQWRETAQRPGSTDITAITASASGAIWAANAEGISRSTDGGATWSRVNSGLPPEFLQQHSDFVTAIATDAGGTAVYAALFDGGIHRLADGTWVPAGDRATNQQPVALLALPSSLLATSAPNGITRSDDGGVTWRASNGGLSDQDIRAIAFHDATVYAGSFSAPGLFRRSENGTWTLLAGLPNSPVMSFAVSRSDPSVIYAGTGGAGVWKSVDGGATWRESGLVGNTISGIAVDPLNPSVAYAMVTGVTLYRTADGGATWSDIGHSLTFNTVLRFKTLSLDAQHGGVVYLASDKAWVSRDGGTTWAALPTGSFVTANENGAYAFVARRFSKSTNAGVTWAPLTPELPSIPSTMSLVTIAVDEKSEAAYVGLIDTTVVPNRPVILRGTGSGWETLPQLASGVLLESLAASDDILYAGTDTRGIYAMSFAPAGPRRRAVRK